MVIRKPNPRLPTANGNGVKAKDGIGLLRKKGSEPVHHWEFLDEIEAPMWVDLTIECNAMNAYEDKDDEWFHTSHLFHQSSSKELKAAFSRIGEISADSDFGISQQSSPKLPPSVSRSRGKDYRSREWGKGNDKIRLDKKHPIKNLNAQSSRVNSGCTKAVKDRTSHAALKRPGASNSACVGSRNSKSPCSQPVPSRGSIAAEGSENNSSTVTSEDSEQQHQKSSVASNLGSSTITYENICQNSSGMSNSTSTVTSELQPQKCAEVSSQVLGRTSDFLSTLRVSLRKSCVTRQALRVVVDSRRQSEGQKSASSRSSIGSSNVHKEDGNQSTRQTKDTTPESRNVFRMHHPLKEKTKLPSMYKGHTHTKQQKASVPNRGNRDVPSNKVRKDKDSTGAKCKRTVATGKENAPGRMDVSQKSSFRERAATVKVQVPKVVKERVPGTSARTSSTGLKASLDNRREMKNPRKTAEKVFLR